MPGVRFGPDIADDAAFIMNSIVSLQQKAKASKTGKLTKRDQSKIDRLSKLALDMFGVSKRDIKAGKFGDLYEMAKYSTNVRNAQGKKIKGRYAPAMTRSRAKATMGEKRRRTRTVMEESLRRSGRTEARGYREGEKLAPNTGGASFLGATKPLKYRQIEQRAMERMAKRGITVDGRKRKIGNRADLDRANIARTSALPGQAGGKSLRPPVLKRARTATKSKRAKSSVRASGQQAKRRKTVKSAGRKKR